MKLPKGDVWMYVLLMFGGGIYLLRRPILDGIAQGLTSMDALSVAVASFCLLTGLLLLIRFRWAPEFYLALMAFFGVWSVVWLYQDGFTAKRIVTIVAVLCGAYGYFALRREIRLASPANETTS